jgi:hypothetical protein
MSEEAGVPEPYENTRRVVFEGRQYIITSHAGNGDSWRYWGTPVDLIGPSRTFSHEEALPVRPRTHPAPEASRVIDDLVEIHDAWHDVLDAIASEIRAGIASPQLRGAFVTYMEQDA